MTIGEVTLTPATVVEEECLEEQDAPRLEMITQIQIGISNLEQRVDIRAELKWSMRREIITFMKRKKKTFGWTTGDMQASMLTKPIYL